MNTLGNQPNKMTKSLTHLKIVSIALLLFSTLCIFGIAEVIRNVLTSYNMYALFVSFGAGFILFTPLVSLVLHPFAVKLTVPLNKSYLSTLIANIGLVIFIQLLFFLIWMTDAIAVYSIYVDQTSFLAKAFDISSKNGEEYSELFLIFNIILAWFFSVLSIVFGLSPCLIARVDNRGVIGNVIASFSYAKKNKIKISVYSLLMAVSVMIPLLYANYLFVFSFPIILFMVFKRIAKGLCR